jgi:hypothetical protein
MKLLRYFFRRRGCRLGDGQAHTFSIYSKALQAGDVVSSLANIWKFYSLYGAAKILSILLYFYENTDG